MQIITVIVVIAAIVWLYILTVLKRANIHGLFYWTGSIGFFLLVTYFFHDSLSQYLSSFITSIINIIGNLTHGFVTNSDSHLIYVRSGKDLLLLNINYECSGILELLVFISLLIFYPIYSWTEKIGRLFEGVIWITVANLLRILLVIFCVNRFGFNSLFLTHSIISRILFYILIIILYYNVFTKQQIIRGWRNN